MSARPSRVAEVRTLTLVPQRWQESIEVYGIIKAAENVDISVDFSAQVKEVGFHEGQEVKQGQALIVLDSRKRALRLEQAQTTVNDAKAALDEARHNLERRRDLAKSGVLSQELLETAEVAMRRAAAQYEDTLAGLRLAKRELAETELSSPVSGLVERRLIDPGETVHPGQVLATVNAAI
ncbi:MAG: efflux RND transporter periplasmic adaptor subunit [Pseudomonadota bacterium]